jgi:hypothetical protein
MEFSLTMEAYPVDSGGPRCSVYDRPPFFGSAEDRFGWREGAHLRNFNRDFLTMRVARHSYSSGVGLTALCALGAASAVQHC